MIKLNTIVQECIDGCTAHNADETRMHFNIKYYVNNEYGQGTKHYLFVYRIEELEENLYNIVHDNISKDSDVVIADITIKHNDEIIHTLKRSYPYSFDYFLKSIIS